MLMKSSMNFSGIMQPLKPTRVTTSMTKNQCLHLSSPDTHHEPSMAGLFHKKYASPFFWHQLYKELVLCESSKESEYDLAEKLKESKWGRSASVGWSREVTARWKAPCTTLANGRVLRPCSLLTVLSSAYKNQVCYSQSSHWQFPLKHHLPSLPPCHVLS